MERSGPERFLTTFALLAEALPAIAKVAAPSARIEIGEIAANLRALRRMSLGITKLLETGENPATEAVVVKEMGNRLENEILSRLRHIVGSLPAGGLPPEFSAMMRDAILHVPSNTLRGGTTEILRGIIARSLGMR